MTQAYIEGFCKAAEAHGVDPQELLKVAAKMDPRQFKAVRRAFNLGFTEAARGPYGGRIRLDHMPSITPGAHGDNWTKAIERRIFEVEGLPYTRTVRRAMRDGAARAKEVPFRYRGDPPNYTKTKRWRNYMEERGAALSREALEDALKRTAELGA